ncbi:phage major tail protein, TP901-1 family [Neobacillus sedimentimangrovi]|uniref:Phage major tail protein, TP901-1 family n=1 Tax=Neobacillus sedimentimangrovi TaxID=2699460 RepID=A0ABS8QKG1_9BACI|nr:phage major tail protein, TP901-1 family [Neobacillus sedimentimangrovi]MCD4839730.1 phage major tail protein, TP901-1 family [Neobacillus sedimentimangrovi]
MSQIKGIDFIINVNIGTDQEPVWTKVAGQRGCTLNRSAETLETTSKDSTSGFKEFEVSFKEWSIEADGLLVNGDTGFSALEDAFMNGEKVKVQMATPSGDKFEGMALITDFPIEAPYDDMATYSVTLQGSGLLSKVSA